ncbi:MAG: hypothetical protein ACOCVC_08280, partial [Spirochaeta sp.]
MRNYHGNTHTKGFSSARLWIFGIAAAVLIAGIFGSCSYYHRATVEGFVEDADTAEGINSVTVRFYQERPDEADSSGFFARTSTATTGGNPGYYRNTVIWDNYFSEYGAEGDTGTVYLGLTHDDYSPQVVEVPGILSDDVNTLETIELQRVTFAAGEVFGRVVRDTDGSGQNGVRVELTIPELDEQGNATGETREYVAPTGDRNGESGWYSFD